MQKRWFHPKCLISNPCGGIPPIDFPLDVVIFNRPPLLELVTTLRLVFCPDLTDTSCLDSFCRQFCFCIMPCKVHTSTIRLIQSFERHYYADETETYHANKTCPSWTVVAGSQLYGRPSKFFPVPARALPVPFFWRWCARHVQLMCATSVHQVCALSYVS